MKGAYVGVEEVTLKKSREGRVALEDDALELAANGVSAEVAHVDGDVVAHRALRVGLDELVAELEEDGHDELCRIHVDALVESERRVEVSRGVGRADGPQASELMAFALEDVKQNGVLVFFNILGKIPLRVISGLGGLQSFELELVLGCDAAIVVGEVGQEELGVEWGILRHAQYLANRWGDLNGGGDVGGTLMVARRP